MEIIAVIIVIAFGWVAWQVIKAIGPILIKLAALFILGLFIIIVLGFILSISAH